MPESMQTNKNSKPKPRKVIIKVMTTESATDDVFAFFENVKNMETGGVLKSVIKGDDGWWLFETPSGKAKIKTRPFKELGILDHTFIAGDLEWNVFVRIIPNEKGSTTTWTFIRPDNLSDEQFEQQLKMFDLEISGWKNALEQMNNA